jgi:hypothetical protein
LVFQQRIACKFARCACKLITQLLYRGFLLLQQLFVSLQLASTGTMHWLYAQLL